LIATSKKKIALLKPGIAKAPLCGGIAGILLSFLACDGKQENSEEPPFVIHGAGDILPHVSRKRPFILNGGPFAFGAWVTKEPDGPRAWLISRNGSRR